MQISDLKPEHIGEYAQSSATCGYYSDRRGVHPSTYLDYAREDEKNSEDPRSRINAVSNAKRAFHLQVERLCDAFGWKVQGKRRNSNFGTLLDYLGQCGVLSPNILRKLNSTRNKVEHDYVVPEIEQVADYVDIVELFLMATKEVLDRFPDSIEYELLNDEDYDTSLELPEPIRISIKMIDGGITLKSGNESREWELSDPDYFSWLSAIVRHYLL